MVERTDWRLVGALGALVAFAGCGGAAKPLGGGGAGHDGGHGGDASVDAPAADVAPDGPHIGSASQVIGPAGGEVDGPSTTKIVVPASAVGAPVMFTIADLGPTPPTTAAVPALPAAVKAVGDVFALTPHGTAFTTPVTVDVSFDVARVGAANGRPLALYTSAPGGGWSAIPSAVLRAGGLEAQVTHFSFFVVGYEAPDVTLPETTSNKLDMLFMVDNSASMLPLQQKLTASFPQLIATLKSLPGGLPDVHIGVVSSSLGAGQEPGIEDCPVGGDEGKLQWMPQGTCTTGPTDHFIAAGAGESTKNYPGTIEDAFSCIALLGDHGCGYEHQLESMAVALGARGAAPPENAGFLRADAALALVMITNEDDCSAPPNTTLFSEASQLVSDPLGPESSYRCNEFGHLCNGVPPPRVGTLGSVVPLAGCVSAEDGRLNRVSEYAALFEGLKADPSQVFLAAITAPATPYAVTFVPPNLDDPAGAWPNVEHSCTAVDGTYGDPSVRIAQLVTAFGDHGSLYSICDEQYASVLTGIGAALARSMGLPCLPKSLAAPASTAPLLTGCTVSESVAVDGGARVETVIPQCGGGADPCWSVTSNMACADTGAQLSITRATPAPVGAVLVARCP